MKISQVLRTLALLFLFGSPLLAERAELVYDNDLVKKTDLKEIGGTDYLPLKSLAVLFKGSTQWLPVANKVIFQLNNQKIVFKVGSRGILIGKEKATLSAPARMMDGTIFVPVDFFTEPPFADIAECKVSWDRTLQMLSATSKATLYLPRIYSGTRRTQVMIESTEEMSPEIRKKGSIIAIEIPKAKIVQEETMTLRDRQIKSIQLSRARKGALLKLELASGVTDYSYNHEQDPTRLVIEIRSPAYFKKPDQEDLEEIRLPERVIKPELAFVPAVPIVKVETSSATDVKKSSEPVTEQAEIPAPPPARRKKIESSVKTIVVDAGHGGKDPGAFGRGGTKEKDINLLMALELARILKIEGGYHVLLTRSDDTFVPLVDRSLFANDKNADLFISIHCNASVRKKEGGFEIYFLAEEASDPHAEEAEKLENAVVELEDPMTPKQRKRQELLFSMAQREFINESSLLSNAINRTVKKRVAIQSRGVKQANFHVLHGVNMPSVLVECAFVTQPQEEQKLRSRKFRSSIVDAILTGVQNYEVELAKLQR